MAIKINNTVVIDDGRGISGTGLTVTSISASGSVGSAGSVLTSTGSAIYWSNGATAVGVASTTVFTSSGSWTKPPVGTYALVTIWGGGGCGAVPSGGGGGGGCSQRLYLMSQLPASPIPITIGAGAASTTTSRAGSGGTSTFGAPAGVGSITAYAGFNGTQPPGFYDSIAGDGGNSFFPPGYVDSIGVSGVYGGPSGPPSQPAPGPVSARSATWGSIIGGQGGTYVINGPFGSPTSIYYPSPGYFGGGGGSGGRLPGPDGNGMPLTGGLSIWGGGGGSASGPPSPAVAGPLGVGGTSIYGGNGGNPGRRNGQPKGGGGAAGTASTASGAGGDGYCLIQVW